MQYDNNIPIYLQVIKDIKARILKGEMQPGEKMPSARDLAIRYQINPNTAARIYKELEQDEICFTKRGLGTFVTEKEERVNTIREEMAAELITSFVKGMKQLGYKKVDLVHILEHRYEDISE